jgi:GAF domain-containing protein
VREETAGAGSETASRTLLTADRLIGQWSRDLEVSGDGWLTSCEHTDSMEETVKAFVRSVRPGGAPQVPPGIPLPVLRAAARSLKQALSPPRDSEADADARKLVLAACDEMLRLTRRTNSGAGASATAHLAKTAARIGRANGLAGIKQISVEAARDICAANSAVWWDRGPSGALSAGASAGAKVPPELEAVRLSPAFWKGETARNGAVMLSQKDGQSSLLSAAGADSGLIVRATAGAGRWVGAISVHGGEFSDEQIDLVVALAHHAGAALRALELDAEKKQLTEVQHRSIAELGFALSSALSVEELLDLVCRSAADLTQADGCMVYLAETDGESVLRAATNTDLVSLDERSDAVVSLAEKARAQPTGRPLVRTGRGSRGVGEALAEAGYLSLAGAPLSVRGEALGALLVLGREPDAFSTVQREILATFAAQAAVAIENIQLVEDMQRRLLEMADLTWVSTRITSTMEVEKIASTVADAASKAMDAPRAALFLVNEGGEYAPIPRGQRGFPTEKRDRLPPAGHLGHEALSLGVPQSVVDSVRDGREDDPLLKWMEAGSLLVVPIVAQQGLQGLLAVGDTTPRDFPSHAVALLSAYANQTALALQSAMLYQDVVRHLRQLENLFEVSRTLTSSLELTQTLDRVLTSATDLLDAPVGTLMLADEDGQELTIKAARGVRPDQEFYRPLMFGEGLAGRAAQSGTALMSADISRDGRFSDRGFARAGGLQAAIAVPLVTRGRTVGVLNLYRRSQREFDADEQRLAAALGNAAAVAIENARLYEETQERAQFLTAMVSEINHRVRNTLQAVAGLLRMEMDQTPPRPIKEVLRRGIARLQSVAVVHDMLQARDLRFVDIKQAARRIVQLTAQSAAPGSEVETRVVGARVQLPSQQATNVAMILSELVDNAVRHGLAGVPDPRVTVSLAEAGNDAVIEVKDNGRGLPGDFDPMKDAGLGLRVVRGVVEEELGGSLEVESNNGVVVRAKFPKRR